MNTLRRVLAKYRDSRVALSEGYQIFLPTVPQEVYHFTDYTAAQQEYTGNSDPARPGSLLYVKNSSGDYVLVGAMYSAPADYTPDQLDAMIPLSVAHWHAHTNICLPNGITLDDVLRGDVGAGRIDMPGMIPVSSSPARRKSTNAWVSSPTDASASPAKSPTPPRAKRRAATCSSRRSAGWSTCTRSTATT